MRGSSGSGASPSLIADFRTRPICEWKAKGIRTGLQIESGCDVSNPSFAKAGTERSCVALRTSRLGRGDDPRRGLPAAKRRAVRPEPVKRATRSAAGIRLKSRRPVVETVKQHLESRVGLAAVLRPDAEQDEVASADRYIYHRGAV